MPKGLALAALRGCAECLASSLSCLTDSWLRQTRRTLLICLHLRLVLPLVVLVVLVLVVLRADHQQAALVASTPTPTGAFGWLR